MTNRWRHAIATLVSAGTLFQFGGCDPTIRATLEDGIINVSTSLLTAVFQALVDVLSSTATA